ncbi:MAG: cupredoxin family copper-binding protein [Nanoarchaeota archaeon]|nr:cupredoxin family copper-binding protein [Nanoarchaeota archaeon]
MAKGLAISLVILAIVIVGFGAFYLYSGSYSSSGNTPSSSGSNTPSGNSNTPSQNSKAVEIKSFAFSPSTLTVNVGDSVTWTNYDSVKHTVTSDSGSELDSEMLSNGQSYSHTFNTPGTYAYHCTPHPGMKATIVVQ